MIKQVFKKRLTSITRALATTELSKNPHALSLMLSPNKTPSSLMLSYALLSSLAL